MVCLFLLHLFGLVSSYLVLHLHYISLSFLFSKLTPFEVFLSQALGLVNSFFLLVSVLVLTHHKVVCVDFLLGVTFDCVPVGGGIFFFPSEGQGCVRWYILECL